MKLFPYQETGAEWLSKMKLAILADEMGLGKTPQAIVAADLQNAKRMLVVCPAVARVNWEREIKQWAIMERDVQVLYKERDNQNPKKSAVICSYEYATKCAKKLFTPWDVLVFDEAHYLKTPFTKRSKAILGSTGLVRHAKTVWALSGTPAPNNVSELWPLLYTFGVTPLSYAEWIEKYCTFYDLRGKRIVTGSKVPLIPEVKEILAPVMLRRKKEDVMTELPPITYSEVFVEAGPVDLEAESSFIHFDTEDGRRKLNDTLNKERRLIESVVYQEERTNAEKVKSLEGIAKSVSTLRRYTGIQKVQPVAELISQELLANAYEKVVIFAIHRDVIEGLRQRLIKFKPVTLYGGTEAEKRQSNIDKFMKYPTFRVFIGNIQASGTAITLTSAHQVVFIEQDWVPGNNAQAAMRCHRIGQKHPVFVRFVALANSIDTKVASILRKKTRELTQLFDET